MIVCIVAGYHGKRFIYERAKELGIRYVIMIEVYQLKRNLGRVRPTCTQPLAGELSHKTKQVIFAWP